MSNVIEFPGPEARNRESVVALLERLLQQAKDGEVVFLAAAWVSADGVARRAWEPSTSTRTQITASLGAVSFLHHSYNAAVGEVATPIGGTGDDAA